jgi:hypothetical protein
LWFVLRGRKSKPPAEAALASLNTIAVRHGILRQAGETPLSWMARLEKTFTNPADRDVIATFSQAYEEFVYGQKGHQNETRGKFLGATSLLRGIRGAHAAVSGKDAKR